MICASPWPAWSRPGRVAMQARSQFVPSVDYNGTVSRGRNDLFGSAFPNNGATAQFRRGHAQRFLGSGSLGPRPAAQRIRPRAISGLRGSPARRPLESFERRGHRLFSIAGVGSGIGNRQPHHQFVCRKPENLQAARGGWYRLGTGILARARPPWRTPPPRSGHSRANFRRPKINCAFCWGAIPGRSSAPLRCSRG